MRHAAEHEARIQTATLLHILLFLTPSLSHGQTATVSATVETVPVPSKGDAADDMAGLDGADWLWSRGGDDLLDGGGGDDVLLGEAGADEITGGGGADALLGGTGNDRLTGGADADMFVFRPGEGHDVVTDFAVGIDKIVLVGHAAPNLAASGGAALVLFGGTEILLQSVQPSTLSLEDFHFLDSL